ncbi:MAG: Methyltransferase type 11 [Myxococcaceae bacterium]|nr:Methyltransferase type 11 [Myxococcaceae bacterium]
MSAFFGELYLRSTRPFLDAKVTAAEIDYLAARFGALSVPGPLLDFGCGHGRHLEVGARLGRPMIGLDRDPLSLSEATRAAPVARGDFFAAPFRPGAFAGVWAWYNSIFTFEDAQISALFAQLARLVRPGGMLILHTLPREKIAADPASDYAGDLPDGSRLTEQVRFNPGNGRDEGRRTLTLPDGRVMAADYFIRYYFLHELEAMLELVGFRTIFVHGGLDASPLSGTSADLILGAQRG